MPKHEIANFSKEKARKIIKFGEKHKLVKKEFIDIFRTFFRLRVNVRNQDAWPNDNRMMQTNW